MSDPAKVELLRVQFSTLEDSRRAVFSELAEVLGRRMTDPLAAKLAGVISAALRDRGLLGSSVEQLYSAAQVAALCGGRSSAWAVKHARLGDFGPVFFDGGDWLIPASGVLAYLRRHQFAPASECEVAA